MMSKTEVMVSGGSCCKTNIKSRALTSNVVGAENCLHLKKNSTGLSGQKGAILTLHLPRGIVCHSKRWLRVLRRGAHSP